MTFIMNFFLLVSIALYSYGRPTPEWTLSTDESLIQESLRKSLHRIGNDQQIDLSQSEAKNIICQTYIEDGLHIKLSFTLERQKWECSLYKLNVETIGIQTDKCDLIEDANPSDENQSSINNDQELDDEAEIDKINQQQQNQNTNDEEEHDDETDVDQVSQQNQHSNNNEEERNDETDVDQANQQNQNSNNNEEEHDDEADVENAENENKSEVNNDNTNGDNTQVSEQNTEVEEENNDQGSEQNTANEGNNAEVNNEVEDADDNNK